MLTRLPYLRSNCCILSALLWKRFIHTSWLRGSSCLCFSKYFATSSGACWSRNRIGQTAADPSTDADADTGSLPHISALIGSQKDGRLDLRPFKLMREVELRGVASGLCRALLEANGQSSLLGVPAVVKSFSICDISTFGCIRNGDFSLSADGPLHILTPVSAVEARKLSEAASACLISAIRFFCSTSSFCAICSIQCGCDRGSSDPMCSRSCRKFRWSCESVSGV